MVLGIYTRPAALLQVFVMAKAKLLVTEVRYSNGENDIYQLPVCFSSLSMITPSDDNFYKRVIAKVNVGDDEGYLCDATFDNRFLTHLYELVIGKESWQGKAGLVSGIKSAKIDAITETAAGARLPPPGASRNGCPPPAGWKWRA